MSIIDICISFIVAILGVGYPILLQVISKLDDKYFSIRIVDLFNKESAKKYYLYSLYTSLILIIYSLKLTPFYYFEKIVYISFLFKLIDYSSKVLLFVSTTSLIFFFILLIEKVLIYLRPIKLLQYLINKHKNKSDIDDYRYFEAISDILIYSIRNQNFNLMNNLIDFLYLEYKTHRVQQVYQEQGYPEIYYQLIHASALELLDKSFEKFSYIQRWISTGKLLIGEIENVKIPEITYNWLWIIQLLSIRKGNDDLLLFYWENSHSYYTYSLRMIVPMYNEKYSEIINKKQIDERELERSQFLEFQYVFGAVLFSKQRYDCLKRIFNYTMQIPPKYELLPETLDDIFYWYMYFKEPYMVGNYTYQHKYHIPQTEGILMDSVIIEIVSQYLAFLFLRLYSIERTAAFTSPLDIPDLNNKTQSEKQSLLNNLPYFKKLVEQLLTKSDVLEILHIKTDFNQWCDSVKKPMPLDLLNNYLLEIDKSIEEKIYTQKPDIVKVEEFMEFSRDIIEKSLGTLKIISNEIDFNKNTKCWYMGGIRQIFPKEAFVDEQTSSYVFFESVLAQGLKQNLFLGLSEIFYLNKTSIYLLKPDDIIPAFNKLNINSDDFMIIAFGLNLNYIEHYSNNFKCELNDEFSKENELNNILTIFKVSGYKIHKFDITQHQLVGQSFFILKKNNLPRINLKQIDSEIIKKFDLQPLIEESNFYGQIIDLFKNEDLRKELEQTNKNIDLKKSVLACLELAVEFKWKNSIEMVQLRVHTDFSRTGVPNELKDVKPFVR